jgi:hypothetical protein
MKEKGKMKIKMFLVEVTIICVGAVLLCLGPTQAGQENWKVLQPSTYGDTGTFSYDAASVKHTKSDTITVWVRSDAGKYFYEMDCKNKKARIIEGTGSGAPEWFNIAAGSADELVYKAVCP